MLVKQVTRYEADRVVANHPNANLMLVGKQLRVELCGSKYGFIATGLVVGIGSAHTAAEWHIVLDVLREVQFNSTYKRERWYVTFKEA